MPTRAWRPGTTSEVVQEARCYTAWFAAGNFPVARLARVRRHSPNRVSIRNIAKHTATYSVAIIAGKLASFILLPIYTKHLTPADYGVMELLDLATFVLGTMLGVRISESLFYFHAEAAEEQRPRVI